MKKGILFLTLITMLFFVSCRNEEEQAFPGQTIPFTLPIELLMQPDVDVATRAPGDPGRWEIFKFPRYVYIYLVAFGDAFPAGKVCELDTDEDGVGEGNLWPEELTTGWSKATNSYEVPQTLNDSIYRHTSLDAHFMLPSGTTSAKVYIAASYEPLKKNGAAIPKLTADHDENNVLAITFDADESAFRNNLQNLYSTPYNYMPAAAPYNGNYYGTVNLKTRVIRMMLYHVAAKVDVKWNVAEDKQDDYYISYIQARQLKQKNCLLFKPTENTWTSADEGLGNNYPLDLVDGDIGQQWLGRRHFYAIPYGPTYNIRLHFLTNGDNKITYDATGYNLKLTKAMSAFPVFTPWIRADLRFSTDDIRTYSAADNEKSLD